MTEIIRYEAKKGQSGYLKKIELLRLENGWKVELIFYLQPSLEFGFLDKDSMMKFLDKLISNTLITNQ